MIKIYKLMTKKLGSPQIDVLILPTHEVLEVDDAENGENGDDTKRCQ